MIFGTAPRSASGCRQCRGLLCFRASLVDHRPTAVRRRRTRHAAVGRPIMPRRFSPGDHEASPCGGCIPAVHDAPVGVRSIVSCLPGSRRIHAFGCLLRDGDDWGTPPRVRGHTALQYQRPRVSGERGRHMRRISASRSRQARHSYTSTASTSSWTSGRP